MPLFGDVRFVLEGDSSSRPMRQVPGPAPICTVAPPSISPTFSPGQALTGLKQHGAQRELEASHSTTHIVTTVKAPESEVVPPWCS